VFCDGISTFASDHSFNNGEFFMEEDSLGLSIFINDELICGIYVGVDAGTCSAPLQAFKSEQSVEIKKSSVDCLSNALPMKRVPSGVNSWKCEGSDFVGSRELPLTAPTKGGVKACEAITLSY
jgi:hypothetical protein